jgi:vanillate O-demethylase monooxygenase subunit
MYHGLKFAPDGRCVEIPGQAAIPAEARVRRYPAVESGSWIWVWMGEAERADPAMIPPSIAGDDPAWRIGTGHLDYDADYQLINDNLLDFSHLGFTHANTLGRGSPRWATERPRVTRLDRGLRFQRWLRDYRDAPSPDRVHELFDLWHSYDFVVPGIFLQRVAWYPLGTADRLNGAPPAEPPIYLRLDEQAVTPMTARTARYYFAAGARSGDVSPAIVARMVRFTERAFQEDKEIIEAQQKAIDLDPSRPMLGTSLDAGPTRFRALMQQLVAAEAATMSSASAA